MFTIIGGDGKEYGPATATQIKAWVAAGRANLETRAKSADADEWRRLGDFPEFVAPELPPMLEPDESELADRGARFFAKLLDEVCSIICMLPGAAIMGMSAVQSFILSSREGTIDDELIADNTTGIAVVVAGLLTISLIQIWMISTRGQTIGKRVFGIRIVRVTTGAYPGFLYGWLLRSLVPGLLGLLPLGLGFLFSIADVAFIFRADRRCLHDHIAGTRVVKA